ncbi:MAG TPA: cell division protein FtsA [Candidatus Woesebacteria bacterium]|nr:cell division protein FtsA [Candidatus Woesebacteria bacterium]HNS94562.1 cell division protein FtsA [Candidatus Woesebacteria bacterium]
MSAKQTLTALDIGTSKIAAAFAVRDESGRLKILGYGISQSQGVRKGVIVDIDQVTEALDTALQKAERMAGVGAKDAYVAVGGPHVASQDSHGVVAVANPKGDISESDVERVIDAAKAISIPSTRHVLSVSPRQFVVDGQAEIRNPVSMSGVRLEVDCNIITASATNLRNVERALESVELDNAGFVFSAAAAGHAVLTDTEKDLGVLIVDVGGGKTDYAVYSEGALCYVASIPIGAKHITNDLAVGLGLPIETAEEMKMYMSNSYTPFSGRAKSVELPDISQYLAQGEASEFTSKTVYEGIISIRIEEILSMVYKDLEKNTYHKLIPAGAVLVGGGAKTIGMQEVAKHIFRVPVRMGKPADPTIKHGKMVVTGLTDELTDPAFAGLVGLLQAADMITTGKGGSSVLENLQMNITGAYRGSGLPKGSSGGIFERIKEVIQQFLP